MNSQIKEKALLVGLVRNAENQINTEIQKISEAFESNYDLNILIIESDSDDSTISTLDSISDSNTNFQYISLGRLRDTIPNRIDRLQFCRNKYVFEIRNNPRYSTVSIVIVADLDGVNNRINSAIVNRAINSNIDWDILTPNQDGPYYDILALRHPLWNDCHWPEQEIFLSKIYKPSKAKKIALSDKMIRIRPEMPPFRVESAFGGIAIYKRFIFDNVDYGAAVDNPGQICEHVILHKKAIEKLQIKIFLHPSFINTGWTMHAIQANPWLNWLKSFTRLSRSNLIKSIFKLITKGIL